VRGLPDVGGLLAADTRKGLAQLGDAPLVGGLPLEQGGAVLADLAGSLLADLAASLVADLGQSCHELRDDVRAGWGQQLALRVLAGRQRGAHVRVAGGLHDEVDVGVVSQIVEAAVRAAADAVLAGQRDARSGRVDVEVVADLDPREVEERGERRTTCFPRTHECDDLRRMTRCVLFLHGGSYDSCCREPETPLEVHREACLRR